MERSCKGTLVTDFICYGSFAWLEIIIWEFGYGYGCGGGVLSLILDGGKGYVHVCLMCWAWKGQID